MRHANSWPGSKLGSKASTFLNARRASTHFFLLGELLPRAEGLAGVRADRLLAVVVLAARLAALRPEARIDDADLFGDRLADRCRITCHHGFVQVWTGRSVTRNDVRKFAYT